MDGTATWQVRTILGQKWGARVTPRDLWVWEPAGSCAWQILFKRAREEQKRVEGRSGKNEERRKGDSALSKTSDRNVKGGGSQWLGQILQVQGIRSTRRLGEKRELWGHPSRKVHIDMYAHSGKQVGKAPVTHEVTALEVYMFLFFSLCTAMTYPRSP